MQKYRVRFYETIFLPTYLKLPGNSTLYRQTDRPTNRWAYRRVEAHDTKNSHRFIFILIHCKDVANCVLTCSSDNWWYKKEQKLEMRDTRGFFHQDHVFKDVGAEILLIERTSFYAKF